MSTTRRGFVASASAVGLLGASSAAIAQKKDSAGANIAAVADSSGFEEALRARFSAGDVLNWTGGNNKNQDFQWVYQRYKHTKWAPLK